MTNSSYVLVVGGPAGTGKTTIGELLAQTLHCPFIEGDALHPVENIEKMTQGTALTDEDRWGWLQKIGEKSSQSALDNHTNHISVVSCSMLKKSYRNHIKNNSVDGSVKFYFVFLYTTFEECWKRVSTRQNHFMQANMVKSQYDIMEIPEGDALLANGGDELPVDTTEKTPEKIFEELKADLDRYVFRG